MDVFMLYASVQASDLKANCCYLNESPPPQRPPSPLLGDDPESEVGSLAEFWLSMLFWIYLDGNLKPCKEPWLQRTHAEWPSGDHRPIFLLGN